MKISNIYLSERAVQVNSLGTLLFPLEEIVANIKKVWKGEALRIVESYQKKNSFAKEIVRHLTVRERLKHAGAALLLILPVINTIAVLIFRRIGVQHPPLAIPVPVQWVAWDRIPAPYDAPNKAVIDALEYRIENKVDGRIEKANQAAKDHQAFYDGFVRPEFDVESERILKDEDSQEPTLNIHCETFFSPKTGIAEARGHRLEMEDTHIATAFNIQIGKKTIPVKLSGIFDGHGGKGMAEFAKEHIVKNLEKRTKQFNGSNLHVTGIWNALKTTFPDLSRSFENKCSGSTANICLQFGHDVKPWIANVGDCRGFTLNTSTEEVVQCTEDQKPYFENYQQGIHKRGGNVSLVAGDLPRLNGKLAMARALGDHELKGAASARPKVTRPDLPLNYKGRVYYISASDGLWDVATTKQVADLALKLFRKGLSLEQIAAAIVKAAYRAGSMDNITVSIREL